MFPREEIIHCLIWEELADYSYNKQNHLPSGVVSVNMQDVAEFFQKVKNNGNKYIVITSCCDYSVKYQEFNPIYMDYGRGIDMFGDKTLGYKPINVNPRCRLDRCNINDKFIIKTYSHTDSTFNEIPDNILYWFTTNACINESRVVNIPFGINNYDKSGDCLDIFSSLQVTDWNKRKNRTYACFQYYTNERAKIHQILRHQEKFMPSLIQTAKDVDFKSFLLGLSENKFVFCPSGNGLDTFRLWEAYYAGAVPIIEENMSWVHDIGLPAYVIGDTMQFHPHLIMPMSDIFAKHNNDPNNYDFLKISTWKKAINNARPLLSV